MIDILLARFEGVELALKVFAISFKLAPRVLTVCHYGLLSAKHMGLEATTRHPRQGLLQIKLRHYRRDTQIAVDDVAAGEPGGLPASSPGTPRPILLALCSRQA